MRTRDRGAWGRKEWGRRLTLAVIGIKRVSLTCHPTALSQISLQILWGTASAMDPLTELQDDLTLDDTSQALNQLKLASIDEKNWPSDEMPDFPKSGGHHWILGSHRHPTWGGSRRAGWGQADQSQCGAGSTSLTGGRAKDHKSQGEHCASPRPPTPDIP